MLQVFAIFISLLSFVVLILAYEVVKRAAKIKNHLSGCVTTAAILAACSIIAIATVYYFDKSNPEAATGMLWLLFLFGAPLTLISGFLPSYISNFYTEPLFLSILHFLNWILWGIIWGCVNKIKYFNKV